MEVPNASRPEKFRPSFVLGVTGQMDLDKLPDGQKQAVRRAVERVLEHLTSSKVDPDLGLGLGLQHSPVILLSSLAPGADTLVADACQDRGFQLVVPLPFPAEKYLRATTFKNLSDKKRQELQIQLNSLGDNAFVVPLLEDLELSADELDRRLEGDLVIDLRRYRRYRAAGEYVAMHSDLLIALSNDPVREEEYDRNTTTPTVLVDGIKLEAGASAIIRVKRQGPTRGLLSINPAFAWADTGPVAHVFTPRSAAGKLGQPAVAGDQGAQPEQPGTITMLYPYDSAPEQPEKDVPIKNTDSKWVEDGESLFRRIAAQLEKFNKECAVWHTVGQNASDHDVLKRSKDEDDEFYKLLGIAGPAKQHFQTSSEVIGRPWFTALDRIAHVRRQAADLSVDKAKQAKKCLLSTFVLDRKSVV
jgi:hypothetical protein